MNLQDLRREYSQGTLDSGDLDPSPFKQFNQWLEQAQQAGFSPDASAMVVATVGDDGQPSQRMVLLKQLDERGFVFFTNLESRKAREIQHNPRTSLHFPWHPMERQVIVYGQAESLSVDDARRYFQSRPRASQIAAWASQQSRKVASRAALEQAVADIEARYPGEEPLPLPEFWGGFRVVPQQIEFWQGRRNRLHDRLVYTRQDNDAWQIERLQP
ncbi:pyridoxamine 5'-phosphate oxidase [Natronospirillum operosum]|uniref:Pyridoxine/pyridoxamine 5'-phosphate oxidase n=2 Tax=Natronospirillum operosum TaxID=2759953 RepID=A0A4Z0WF95_9GAMM|nr:pyridoxamine 5'-phosphate oxidase [Natronospirillum operosum]